MKPTSHMKSVARLKPGSRTLSALAIALLLGASTARSQSVGDILNKAKDVKNKAQNAKDGAKKDGDTAKNGDASKDGSTSKDNDASKDNSASQDGDASKGADSSQDGESARDRALRRRVVGPARVRQTVEQQQQYVLKMQADKRKVSDNENPRLTPNYFYRLLTVNDKVPIKFTCDDAAVKVFLSQNADAWNQMERASQDLLLRLVTPEYAPYLKVALSKVKEIHFTTTSLANDANNKGYRPYLFSFNPTTGVLTAAAITARRGYVDTSGPHASDVTVAYWMLAHMTNAPKPRPVDNAAASADGDSSSSSSSSSDAPQTKAKGSQVKSWTCAWCHETVEAPTRPPLDGCPRNKSGQHAWHN